MSKINYSSLITESLPDLEARFKTLSSLPLRDRCEVLIWLKSGKVSSMMACMALKNHNKSTGVLWWRTYREKGLDYYLSIQRPPNRSVLDDHPGFWERLGKDGFASIKEARDWLASEHQIIYTENGLGNYFRRHKIKCKTGRPHHPQQSVEERAKYKKNMKPN